MPSDFHNPPHSLLLTSLLMFAFCLNVHGRKIFWVVCACFCNSRAEPELYDNELTVCEAKIRDCVDTVQKAKGAEREKIENSFEELCKRHDFLISQLRNELLGISNSAETHHWNKKRKDHSSKLKEMKRAFEKQKSAEDRNELFGAQPSKFISLSPFCCPLNV